MSIRKIPLEALVWIIALISLAFYYPGASHVTLCPLANLGLDFCPGCGLGRSISFAFHGEFVESFQTHPLGIAAIIILLSRIIILFKNKPNPAWQK